MAKNIGIQLNTNGDLLVTNGSLSIGEVTNQNIYLLLACGKGEWKEYPTLGIGINDAIGEENTSMLMYNIRKELVNEGLSINELKITNEQLFINAQYK